GTATADEVLTKLRGMQKAHLIDLEDACVVVHTEAGKIQMKQAVNLTARGAATGASTGMLIGALAGLLVLHPPARSAVRGVGWAGRGRLWRFVGFIGRLWHRRRLHQGPWANHSQRLVGIVHADQELNARQGSSGNRALQAARP